MQVSASRSDERNGVCVQIMLDLNMAGFSLSLYGLNEAPYFSMHSVPTIMSANSVNAVDVSTPASSFPR